jgi:hypothetical protein
VCIFRSCGQTVWWITTDYNDWDILAHFFRCEQRRFPCRNEHVDLETCQFASKHRKLLIVAVDAIRRRLFPSSYPRSRRGSRRSASLFC